MIISTEILAQRLEHVAAVYDKDAATARAIDRGLCAIFERQAHESRLWADAIRNAGSIGFDGDDLEIIAATGE